MFMKGGNEYNAVGLIIRECTKFDGRQLSCVNKAGEQEQT